MFAFRSQALRLALGLVLTLGAGSALVAGCTPPDAKSSQAKKSPKKQKPKDQPKNPWLDEVLASADVVVKSNDGKTTRCKWNSDKKRHICPGQESWVYVGPQVLKVGEKQEYCVWQHPADAATVTTTLKGLATQPLEVRHAFAGASAGVKQASPVDVVLRIDGEERAKAKRLREPGFSKVRLEPAKEGKPGDVQIVVSAPDVGVAHFCWQVERLGGDKPVAKALEGAAPTGEAATATTPEVKAAAVAAPEAKATEAKATEAKATEAKATEAKATDVDTAVRGKLERARLKGPLAIPTQPAAPRRPLSRPADR